VLVDSPERIDFGNPFNTSLPRLRSSDSSSSVENLDTKLGIAYLRTGEENLLFRIQCPNPNVRLNAHAAKDLIADLSSALAIPASAR
jgi:hypothetical protein